jgi:hypothetical protein
MARTRGTARNLTHNGIRTRFLDQVSIAAFRPADAIGLDVANWLALNNVFYGDPTTQTGTGTIRNSNGLIDGQSTVIFRNCNIANTPSIITDPGINKFDVYINGLFLEKSSFVTDYPQNLNSDLILVIDNTGAALENNLDTQDLIVITGKLNAL